MFKSFGATLGEGSSAAGFASEPAAGFASSIGRIEAISGACSLTRTDGVVVEIKVGDPVSLGDVIETAANGRIGIRFIDGTVFSLNSDARIALNEFECEGGAPSALFDVTRGTFAFIAGEMAKAGHLGIDTPVASIRGRTKTGGVGMLTLAGLIFAVMEEAHAESSGGAFLDDGTITYNGVFELVTKEAIPRHLLVDNPEETVVLQRVGSSVNADQIINSPEQMKQLQAAQQDALHVFALGLAQGPTITGPSGSGALPSLEFTPSFVQPINFSEPTNIPFLPDFTIPNSGPTAPPFIPIDVPYTPPPPTLTKFVVWTSPTGGSWNAAPNWNINSVPSTQADVEINSAVVVTIDDAEFVNSLLIGAGATLDIVSSGSLTIVGSLDDSGLIKVSSTSVDPTLDVTGAVTVESGGEIEAVGSAATVDFAHNTLINFGSIFAVDHGTALFEYEIIYNLGGTIAAQQGGIVTFDHSTISNAGTLEAAGGELYLNDSSIENAGGQVTVDGGGALTLNDATIDGGQVSDGGAIHLTGSAVIENGSLGNASTLDAAGSGNKLDNETITNTGTIAVLAGGALTVDLGSSIENAGGQVTVDGGGALTLNDATIDGGQVSDGGAIHLTGSAVIENGSLDNASTLDAAGSGNRLDNETITNTGTIAVLAGGALTVDLGSSIENADGQVTVDGGGALTLNDATIDGGQVSDGGAIHLTGSAVIENGSLDNASTLDAAGSGNRLDNETITNTGTIAVLAGGALTVDLGSSIENADGQVTVDGGGALTLNDATIDGGQVSDGGAIHLTGSAVIENGSLGNASTLDAAGSGNKLDNETITNTGTIAVLAGGALTVDLGSSIENAGGQVTVDGGGALTLNDATIDGGQVSDGGAIHLTGSAVIENGSLGNASTLDAAGSGNKLDNETITNTGTIAVLAGGALTVDLGSSIENAGGQVTVDGGGALTLNDATIDGGQVSDGGAIHLTGSAVIENGSLGNASTLDAAGSGNKLDNETITNTGTIAVLAGGALTVDLGSSIENADGQVTVDGGGALTLNDATIDGGQVSDGGAIHLTGSAVIENGSLGNASTLDAAGSGNKLDNETITNTGTIAVLAGGALTVDLGSSIENAGGQVTVDGGGALTLNDATIDHGQVSDGGAIHLTGSAVIENGSLGNAGTLDAAGSGNKLDNETITNTGTIAVLAAGALTVDLGSSIENAGGQVTVDGGGALTLNDATINHGQVSDGGAIHLTGSAVIENGSLGNAGTLDAAGSGNKLDNETITNTGTIAVLAAGALTVDLGSSIENAGGQVTVDGGGALTLNDATINHGQVSDGGAIHLTGSAVIENGSLGNAGTLDAAGSGNKLDNETITNTGTIAVLAAGALTVDLGSSIENAGGQVTVDGGGALTLNDATINHGQVSDGGAIHLTGSAVIENGSLGNAGTLDAAGSGNKLDNETITNTGTIAVLAAGALTVDLGSSIENAGGQVTVDGGGALTLNDATINHGQVSDGGAIHLTGSAVIENGSLGNAGTLDAAGSGNKLDNETITNTGTIAVLAAGALTVDLGSSIENAGGQVTVDGGGALTLNDATIDHGQVSDGGAIHLTGSAVIENGSLGNAGTLDAAGSGNKLDNETITNTGTIAVLAAGALTVDLGSSIENAGGQVTVDGGGALTLNDATIDDGQVSDGGAIHLTGSAVIENGSLGNAGTLDAAGSGNKLDNETITNTGTIAVLAAGALTVDLGSSIENAGGQVTVDGGGALTLNDATINHGQVSDGGAIHLTGSAVIENGSLGNAGTLDAAGSGNKLDNETITNTGTIAVLAAGALTVDLGSSIENAGGQVTVDGGGALTLNDATIDHGQVSDGGAIHLTGSAVIENGSLGNAGTLDAAGSGNKLDNETITNTGTIAVLAAGALTVDLGSSIENADGQVTVDGGGALTLDDATIDGGQVSDGGAIHLTGSAVIENGSLDNASTLDAAGSGNRLDNETITNTGTIAVLAGGALTVDLAAASRTPTGRSPSTAAARSPSTTPPSMAARSATAAPSI